MSNFISGLKLTATSIACLFLTVSPVAQNQKSSQGTAAAFPWVFKEGTPTAHATAQSAVEEITRRAGFSSVPKEVSASAWRTSRLPGPRMGSLPTRATLRTFARAVKADRVLYGSVSWHTRSIWVNAGPKTISNAKVDVYVYDANTNKVVFKRLGVSGRSDEKSNGYKIAAAILLTPIVTAVSGGPATPQEQRAVQIALGNAYAGWVNAASTRR